MSINSRAKRNAAEAPKVVENIFEQLIRQNFPYLELYIENHSARTLSFRVAGSEIEYDRLEKISKIMDTKLINFRGITVQNGYCETCASEDRYISVECSGVRFFEYDPIPAVSEIVGDPNADWDDWD